MKSFPAPKFNRFTLENFQLESGIVLPKVDLAYHISGKPDANPPILTCTAFAQTYYDLAYLRGPKFALNLKNYWIIHTELLGNGRSSSPSNTPVPFDRANFPAITIRDNVALQYALLQHLGVKKVRAVIGVSMGGQQAIQWAVSYPEIVEKVVVIAGNCRATWHVRLFIQALADCIRSDPIFNDGYYTTPPLLGLSRMAAAWAPWTFSPEFYSSHAYQNYPDTRANSLDDFLLNWRTRYHGNDANDVLCHLQTWSNHDVSLTPKMEGLWEKALGSIKAQVLFLPISTDAYFAPVDIAKDATSISKAEVIIIDSINGHSAGFGRSLSDRQQINQAIARFLA